MRILSSLAELGAHVRVLIELLLLADEVDDTTLHTQFLGYLPNMCFGYVQSESGVRREEAVSVHTWIFAQILEQPLLIKPILEIRLVAVCRGLELGITRGWGSIRPLALWSRFELDGPTKSAFYHQHGDVMDSWPTHRASNSSTGTNS
jgi:hypothetical protein